MVLSCHVVGVDSYLHIFDLAQREVYRLMVSDSYQVRVRSNIRPPLSETLARSLCRVSWKSLMASRDLWVRCVFDGPGNFTRMAFARGSVPLGMTSHVIHQR